MNNSPSSPSSDEHDHDHEHEHELPPGQIDCCDVAAARIIAKAIDRHRNGIERYLKTIAASLDYLARAKEIEEERRAME